MSYINSESPRLDMDFLGMDSGMDLDAALTFSPQSSHILDCDNNSFAESMFSSPIDPPPATDELSMQNFGQLQPSGYSLNTTIQTAFGYTVPLKNGAIGDRFYNIQQAPQQPPSPLLPSPSIVVGDQSFGELLAVPQPNEYFDRDFVHGTHDRICLRSSPELSQSGQDMDLMEKVSRGFNVRRIHTSSVNMNGVVALHWGIASVCQPLGRNPPSEQTLLQFLVQALAKVPDGPRVTSHGLDRPLTIEHLLMMLHRYGLRYSEQYNIGIIRPEPLNIGGVRSYQVAIEGPRTERSKTMWLYNEEGSWHPLVKDGFQLTTMSYAEALQKQPRSQAQRPVTPIVNNHLHPDQYSPSTPYTYSDIGTDVTGATSLSCRSCGRTFTQASELTHHSRNHRPRNLFCSYPDCGKSFLWNKDLQRHIQTHTGRAQRLIYICKVSGCGRRYLRQDNLRRHHRLDHADLPPLPAGSSASSRRSGAAR